MREHKLPSLLRRCLDIDPADGRSWVLGLKLSVREEGKWTNSTPSWRSNLPPLPPHPDALEAERCFHEALTYCPSNYHVLASYLRYLTVHHPEHRTEEYMSRIYSSILKHDPSNQHGPLIWSRYLLLSKNSPPSALAVLHNATLHPTASSAVLQDYFSLTLTQKPEMIPELFSSNLPRVRGKDYVEFVLLYVRYCYAMGKSLEAEEWLDKAEQVEGKLGTDWCGVERRKRGPRTPSQVVKSSQGLMARLGEVELDDVVHDSSLLISWAKVKEHDGNVEDAVDILEVARGRFPTDVGVWLSLGRIWEKKDKEKALKFYKESLLMGSGVEGLVKVAQLIPGASDKMSYYARALELGINDGSVYNAYGSYLTRIGRVEEAGEVFEKGLRVCTRDRLSLYHGNAKMLISVGDRERAEEILVKAIREGKEERTKNVVEGRRGEKKEAFVRHTLGMLYLKEGDVVKAKKVFEDGLVEGGGDEYSSRIELGAALCSVRLGDEENARAHFDRSITSDHSHAHAWQAWSIMEIKAANFTVAKTLIECGLKNCPDHGALWQVCASMENRQGNIEQAQNLYFQGIKRCRGHVPLYLDYALLELKEGGQEEGVENARKLVDSAMGLTRNNPNGNVWCTAFKVEELASGSADSCRKVLEEGLDATKGQVGKDRVKLLQVAGDFYTKYGRYEQAREHFSEGLSLDPLSATIYHSWAQMEASIFNLEGLQELNKRAVKLFSADALQQTRTLTEESFVLAKRSRRQRPKLPPRLERIKKSNEGKNFDDLLGGDVGSLDALLNLENDDFAPSS